MIRINWPYRPDFEAKTLVVALVVLGCLVAGSLYFTLVLGWPVLIPAAVGFAAVAGLVLSDVLTRQRLALAREGLRITRISRRALAKIARDNPTMLYLGEGFKVGADEARAIYLLSESGAVRDFVTDDPELNHGAVWMRVLAKVEPIFIPLRYLAGHMGVFGTTRAGKTKCLDLVVNQLLARGETVLIIDPKGSKDLKDSAEAAARAIGTRFHYFHLAHPDKSVRMSPIANGNFATELATRISVNIPSASGGSDPFTAVSHMALTHVIGGILALGRRPTLSLILEYLQRGPDGLLFELIKEWTAARMPDAVSRGAALMVNSRTKKMDPNSLDFQIFMYQHVVAEKHKSETIEGLISIYEHDKEHLQKMITSLMPVMTNLTAGEMGPLLSPDRKSVV